MSVRFGAFHAQRAVSGCAACTQNTLSFYDGLGRKTAMRDPDMGLWAYGYDPAGNLVTQTDALSQTLWFRYDALNRLTEKRLGGGGGTLLASYGYDQGANGVGRVVTQTKTIDGVWGAFMTLYAYDAADRVVTLAHPGGEVVTTTYNAAGQAERLEIRDGLAFLWDWRLVSDAAYNALGQPQVITFGNEANLIWTRFLHEALRFFKRLVCTLKHGVGSID